MIESENSDITAIAVVFGICRASIEFYFNIVINFNDYIDNKLFSI